MPLFTLAQDSVFKISVGYLEHVEEKSEKVCSKILSRSDKALQNFKKQEEKIYRKLLKVDSTKAKNFLKESQEKYELLDSALSRSTLPTYFGALDTLKTSLSFLQANQNLLSGKEQVKKLNAAIESVEDLQGSLGNAEMIKTFLKERRNHLKLQLEGLPISRELTRLNKAAYYYAAQIKQYKSFVSDKKKLEKKALDLLVKSKPFKDFMRKNSELAKLFRIPSGEAEGNLRSLQGLQTRAQVNSQIQNQLGLLASSEASGQLRANINGAQEQINALKRKASSFVSGSADPELPEGFKPNHQKTKSFLSRLEVGANIQNQKARFFFPMTSDIALSAAYKLNNNGSIGVGGSYKLGLGSGWEDIELSHQGVGIRTFIDYRLKGKFFITGGYEQNYRSAIKNISDLKNHSGWLPSGIVGVTKKYTVNKKINGSIQLLWDFMSYNQIPKSQPILFRIGYSLK